MLQPAFNGIFDVAESFTLPLTQFEDARMNAIIDMLRRIKAAVSLLTNPKARLPARTRIRLDGRRGYGDDDIPPPSA